MARTSKALGVLVLAGIGYGAGLSLALVPRIERRARARLNAAYREAGLPAPPLVCQTDEAVGALTAIVEAMNGGRPEGKRPEDRQSRERLHALGGETGSAEYWTAVARAELFVGEDLDASRSAAERAVKLCPDFSAPYKLRGSVHLLDGELDAAKAAFEEAALLAPDDLAPRFDLGLVHLGSGRIREAIEAFTAVLSRDPAYAVAYQTRAAAYASTGAFESARADLAAAIRLQPSDAKSHRMLGDVLGRMGRAEEARSTFCRARDLGDPSSAERCKEE